MNTKDFPGWAGLDRPFIAGGTRFRESDLPISEWTRRRLDFHPDDAQRAVLDSAARRGIVCSTRQWGKSTIAAALAVHAVATQPGAAAVILAPTKLQCGELINKCAAFFKTLRWSKRNDGHNPHSLLAPNDSRILALSATAAPALQGPSAPSLLVVDDAAFVGEAAFDAVTPTLAASPGARLWLLSTPHGKLGRFYETWHSKDPAWVRFRITAEDCPRISREFLDEQRATLTSVRFRERYLCGFVDHNGPMIPAHLVDEALVSGWPWENAA